ncbi:hypothetical protein CC78DRAFT_41606 [Lojkania enalia]|uniref:Uncharacterized protein n=1 Tax=Lojkania enalia TaxID=147567 RepID=A0A9P4K0P6_9PLEO|nr:hypothetical protein CC78DRAFT_41606 [Didymosphaeria enalia]
MFQRSHNFFGLRMIPPAASRMNVDLSPPLVNPLGSAERRSKRLVPPVSPVHPRTHRLCLFYFLQCTLHVYLHILFALISGGAEGTQYAGRALKGEHGKWVAIAAGC